MEEKRQESVVSLVSRQITSPYPIKKRISSEFYVQAPSTTRTGTIHKFVKLDLGT